MGQELEYVVNGALMMCNQGTVPTPINVTSNLMVKAACMNIATDADKMPMTNIPPFGICLMLTKTNPVPCMPSLIQWLQTKTDVNINHHKPLLSNSCAMCGVGGKVEFLMNGQLPMPPEVKTLVDEAKKANDELLEELEREQSSIGESSFWEGMIPIWGSGRDTIYHFQMGNYGRATLNAVFCVTDVFLVTAIVKGIGKAAIKGGLRKTISSAIGKKMAAARVTGAAAIQAVKKYASKEGMEALLKKGADAAKAVKQFFKGLVKTGARKSTFIDDLLKNPKSIWGKSAEEIAAEFRKAGYKVTIEQSTKKGTSGLAQQIRIKGHPQITNIQVHPGGGRKGGAYYKISTSDRGKIRVVDGKTYEKHAQEKDTIIDIND